MSPLSRALTGSLSVLLLAASPVLAAPASKAPSHGIDLAGMDRAVKPGDNFFEYTNGTWWKRTTIPADHAGYGTFNQLSDLANQRTVALIKATAQKRAPKGSEAQKIADYYSSYLDAAAIEKKGLGPLQPTLDGIAAIANAKDLARVLGSQLRADVDLLNATNFYTDSSSASGSRRTSTTRATTRPTFSRAGWACPTGTTTSHPTPRMAAIRRSTRRTSPRCSSWPGFPTPRPRPSKSSASRSRSPRRTGRRGHAGRAQGEQPLVPRRVRRAGARVSTGRPTSPPPGSGARSSSSSGSQEQ